MNIVFLGIGNCRFKERINNLKDNYKSLSADENQDEFNNRFNQLVVDVISKSKHLEIKYLETKNVKNILKNVYFRSRPI